MGTGGGGLGVGTGGGEGLRVGTGGGLGVGTGRGGSEVGTRGAGLGAGTGRGMEVGAGGGGLGVSSGRGLGVGSGGGRSDYIRVVDGNTPQREPDLPLLNPAQHSLTDQTLRSVPSAPPGTPHPKSTVQASGGQKLVRAAFSTCAPSPAAGRGTPHLGRSGLAARDTPRRGGGGRRDMKGLGESYSEDKENSVTRCIVERQEKQLQALQEKVRGCPWGMPTAKHAPFPQLPSIPLFLFLSLLFSPPLLCRLKGC